MKLLEKIKVVFAGKIRAEHLQRGTLGERAAKIFLQKQGLKFLTANFRSERGEVDLIFRDDDCLAFVEVKTRSSEDWSRPAAAVNSERRRRLSHCALDYLRKLKNPARENPFRHRGSFARGRRSVRGAPFAEHVRDEQAVPLRLIFNLLRDATRHVLSNRLWNHSWTTQLKRPARASQSRNWRRMSFRNCIKPTVARFII